MGSGRRRDPLSAGPAALSLLLALGPAGAAAAAPADASPAPDASARPLLVEAVELTGVAPTRRPAMQALLLVEPGTALDEAAVEESRLRLLATGLFRSVEPRLKRGRAPGRVRLIFACEERQTFSLDAVHLGVARPTGLWGGLAASDRDPIGLGWAVSGAFVASEPQRAFAMSLGGLPSFGGSLQVTLGGRWVDGEEPFVGPVGQRLRGAPVTHVPVPYQRGGGELGLSRELGPLTRMVGGLRLERVSAALPPAAEQLDPGGEARPFDFHLHHGATLLSVFELGVEHDARDHPVRPTRGGRAGFRARTGTGGYGFLALTGSAEHARRLALGHVLRLEVTAGALLGDAPFFERFFVGDLHPWIPERVLGLNFARRRGPHLVPGTLDEKRYESLAGRLTAEYRIPLGKRGGETRYGTELYLAGVFLGLGSPESVRPAAVREALGDRGAFPFDAAFDLGIRIESELGLIGFGLTQFFRMYDP